MINKDYALHLNIAGPLLSAGVGAMRFGVDAAMARYPHSPEGLPVLNGSLVRGNLLAACRQFMPYLPAAEQSTLEQYLLRWFGSEGDDLLAVYRSQIDFDFFWTLSASDWEKLKDHAPKQRTRIAMDKELDKIKQGALQVAEDVFESGSVVTFSGKMFARFEDDVERKAFEHWMQKALQFIPAVGSFKGVGYGRLLPTSSFKVATGLTNLTGVSSRGRPLKLAKGVTRFGIRLFFDRPFCIGKLRTPQDNRLVSEQTIPGTVLKGVIARQFDLQGTALSEFLQQQFCFDDLVVSHAVAAESPAAYQRAAQLPFSAARVDDAVYDLALCASAEALQFSTAPSFQIDMKPAELAAAKKAFAIPDLHVPRHLMVRTRIDDKGVSAQSALFSMECIAPENLSWYAEIDLVNIAEQERQKVFKNITALFKDSLRGVGKTKARVQASIFLLPKPKKKTLITTLEGYWVIELVTACSLLPRGLTGHVDAKHLHDLYATYWHDVSHGTLSLSHFYARQSRVGGAFYHKHFQAGDAYEPEWLSDAGSVFVLKANDDAKARQLIEGWFATGLPHVLNSEVANTVGWQDTPYLPEHGYGEIQLNHQRVKNLMPTFVSQEVSA